LIELRVPHVYLLTLLRIPLIQLYQPPLCALQIAHTAHGYVLVVFHVRERIHVDYIRLELIERGAARVLRLDRHWNTEKTEHADHEAQKQCAML
jgi:hypothetical protein